MKKLIKKAVKYKGYEIYWHEPDILTWSIAIKGKDNRLYWTDNFGDGAPLKLY